MVGRWSVVVALVATCSVVRADSSTRSNTERGVEGAVVFVAYVGVKSLHAIDPPAECRWCETNAFDVAIRDVLVWNDVRAAQLASDVTGYVLPPVLAATLLIAPTIDDPSLSRWYDDALPVVEAGVIASITYLAVKHLAARRRPYVAFRANRLNKPASDANASFFSGHTAHSSSIMTAAATVASLRGYSTATPLWIGDAAITTTTGYLRIAADAHWATDVIVAAVAGSAIGLAVPLLLHRDQLDEASAEGAVRAPRDVMISLGGVF
jgi:membrane-associated phospholipid phosphatase